MGRSPSDKRERLINAAIARFHSHGLANASLADIARDADVPAGNVFYYFRAKNDLVRAVVDSWHGRIAATLGALLPDRDPNARILAFLDGAAQRADAYAAHGCPLAALATDLRRSGDPLAALTPRLTDGQIDWIGKRLIERGDRPSAARTRAEWIVASLQGSYQLAFALADPSVVHHAVDRLKRSLAESPD